MPGLPREAQAIWYLAGSRQEVQLNIGISQAVGVHGLQSLQEKKKWSEGLARAGHSAVTDRHWAQPLESVPPIGPPYVLPLPKTEKRMWYHGKSSGMGQTGVKAPPCPFLAV